MTEIICACIAASASILCAVLAHQNSQRNKAAADAEKRTELRSKQRAEESRLSLALMNANCSLTVGVALALKNNHCNGEVEQGLADVKKAQEEYIAFMENIAINHLVK